MEDIFTDFINCINSDRITLGNMIFRIVLSMALGIMVGAERKRKGQIAGVRTFALISMGACLSMLLSIYVPQEYLGLKNGDPGRIAAQVITGVGFLGGGAMIHMKGAVRGLTTAAGIWMTAAIGMAVGVGMYWISIFSTAMILVTLVLFEVYEQRANMGHESRVIRLQIKGIVKDIAPYGDVLKSYNVHLNNYFLQFDYENDNTSLNLVILAPIRGDYLPLFDSLRQINPTKELTLTALS